MYKSRIFLSIGSNVGNRFANIKRVLKMLPLTNMRCSKIYETKALLPVNYIKEWDFNYLKHSCHWVCEHKSMEIFDQKSS